MTTPTNLLDRVETFEDHGLWGFRVACPGEDAYRSPAVYDTEPAARAAGAADLAMCLHPTGFGL
jgi:hypothetical protein